MLCARADLLGRGGPIRYRLIQRGTADPDGFPHTNTAERNYHYLRRSRTTFNQHRAIRVGYIQACTDRRSHRFIDKANRTETG